MKYYLTTIAIVFSVTAWSQEELGSHFLRGTWQAQYTNPALIPEGSFFVKLPGVYNNIHISSVTYNDLIVEEGDKTILDIDRAIAKLDDQNLIREQLQITTFGLGANFGNLNLHLQHSLRYNAFMDYPKTLPQLIWQGNAQFIGQQVDVSTDTHLFGYHELALGAALEIGKHLTIGGRFKFLGGIADAATERNQLLITTDTLSYALELDADLLVNSSGTVSYESFRELGVNFDFGRFDLERIAGGNNGYAFDLGVQLRLGKLDLAASMLDIGRIRWDRDVSNYSLEGIKSFDGLDISEGLLSDSTSFGSVIDSLEQAFGVTETDNAFEVRLATQAYFSAGYQLNESWRLGALFYMENYRGRVFPAAAVAANAQLLPFLNLGATYAWRSESFDNLGLNAVLRAGPLQIVAATDNILSALQLKDSHSANLRVGLNLAFARKTPETENMGPRDFFPRE